MNGLTKRVRMLEGEIGEQLSPRAKAWLGQPLTEAERTALARGGEEAATPLNINTLSQEAQKWLGIA